ncbi:MAG TPA: protein kinase [Polyangiaceae bacterium]|nr:protein kinase [Polyangiaceae bacterium]
MTMLLGAVRAGDVLARKYRVERILGAGGMGVVVAARHELLRERVAVKLLSPERTLDKTFVRRFLSEARSTAKLKSEHVARVMDVGTLDEGTPYLVMELLEGRDLSQILNEHGPVPAARAVDYVLQACAGLAEAHRHGIVHRDLKPANLFLTARPDGSPLVKVLDFGLAKRFDDSIEATKTGQIVGSPNYMAPEQVSAPSSVDTRVDVWALGVILYELVSGSRPFAGNTVSEIFALILHGAPPPLRERVPSLSPDLEAVVACCLERDRDRRFDNVESLAAALARYATGAAPVYAPAYNGPHRSESTLLLALSPTTGATSLAGGASLTGTAIVAAPAPSTAPGRTLTPAPPPSTARAFTPVPPPSPPRALTPVPPPSPPRALTPAPSPARALTPVPPPARMAVHEPTGAYPVSQHLAAMPRSADPPEPWANGSQVSRSQAWVWPLRVALAMALLAGSTLVAMRSRHLIAAPRREGPSAATPGVPNAPLASGPEGAAKAGASKPATPLSTAAPLKPTPKPTAAPAAAPAAAAALPALSSTVPAPPAALPAPAPPAPSPTPVPARPASAVAATGPAARPAPTARPAPRPIVPARRTTDPAALRSRDEKAELFDERTW